MSEKGWSTGGVFASFAREFEERGTKIGGQDPEIPKISGKFPENFRKKGGQKGSFLRRSQVNLTKLGVKIGVFKNV